LIKLKDVTDADGRTDRRPGHG